MTELDKEHQLRALRKGRLELLANDLDKLPETYQPGTAERLHGERVLRALGRLLKKKK